MIWSNYLIQIEDKSKRQNKGKLPKLDRNPDEVWTLNLVERIQTKGMHQVPLLGEVNLI